ncbi:3-oxoacid CoA-transferase subunit A, partial [Rhodovulum sulfidophilum]|nr:3-oxoacid CoA-transferase subunit A [Rhodovulum sulfidophilum]
MDIRSLGRPALDRLSCTMSISDKCSQYGREILGGAVASGGVATSDTPKHEELYGMINKFSQDIAEALADVPDAATVLLGGFGAVGQANLLIEGLLETGVSDLTIVANNAGYGKIGLARLLREGRVRKLICSYPRIVGSTIFEELYGAGKLELELVPQGTLAERMRAAGAGIPAFFTPTGAHTLLSEGKEIRDYNGLPHVLEQALHGDVALIEAWEADRWGNLTYRDAGR